MAELFSLETTFGVNTLFFNFYHNRFEKELLSPNKEIINMIPISYKKIKKVKFYPNKNRVTFKFGLLMLDLKKIYIDEDRFERLKEVLKENEVSYEIKF